MATIGGCIRTERPLVFDNASPANVLAGDVLGEIDFVGQSGNLPVTAARIVSLCTSVAGGLWSAIDFHTISAGVPVPSWRMESNSPQTHLIGLGSDPQIFPNTTRQGSVGTSSNVWLRGYFGVLVVTDTAAVGGATSGTALVHVAAGTAAVGTAPIKIDPGVVLTVPESGAIETTNDHIYWTNSTGTRLQLDNSGGATTTLAATYTNGASAADQTMTIATAKGGGIVVDASTAAVTAGDYSFSVRQSASQVAPTALARRGNDAVGPILELNKARGTFAAPADVQDNDAIGDINFVCRLNGVPNIYNIVEGIVLHVGSGPTTITTGIDFYATGSSTLSHAWRMGAFANNGGGYLTGYGSDPVIQPTTDGTGLIGVGPNTTRWRELHVLTAFAYTGIAVGAGINPPAALMHVHAGTAAAGTAPIKINPGVVLTVPESGAIETTNDHIYWTNNAGARLQLDNVASSGTLAVTYTNGASAADQTIALADVNGGGVLVDATGAGFTTGFAMEVRQNALHDLPIALTRYINQVPGPELELYHSRGTFGSQINIQANDELGTVNFYGRLSGAPVLGSRITAVQIAIAPNATSLDFYITPRSAGAPARAFQMNSNGAGANSVLSCFNDPEILPDVDHHGLLGESTLRWSQINVDDARVYGNVRMGGGSVGGGANLTVMLSNANTIPVPQADQVYFGTLDFGGGGAGSNLAAIAVAAEEPAISGQAFADYQAGIPFHYNGKDYYLLARDMTPA